VRRRPGGPPVDMDMDEEGQLVGGKAADVMTEQVGGLVWGGGGLCVCGGGGGGVQGGWEGLSTWEVYYMRIVCNLPSAAAVVAYQVEAAALQWVPSITCCLAGGSVSHSSLNL
jgi:hypothetical protein